jgi:uncharacterized membrane protein
MDANRQQVEVWVGHMLRYGVLLAAVVVLAGGIRYLHGALHHSSSEYARFRVMPETPRTIPEICARVRAGDTQAMIQAGLVLLILTPIARVVLRFCSTLVRDAWALCLSRLRFLN